MSFSDEIAKDMQVKSNELILEAISLHAGLNVDVKWCAENKNRLSSASTQEATHYLLDKVVVLIMHNNIDMHKDIIDGQYIVSANSSYELIKPTNQELI